MRINHITIHPVTNAKTVYHKLDGNRDHNRDHTHSTSGPDLDLYTNGQYAELTMDINYALHTLGFAHIDIYLDASGNTYTLDSNGNIISNRYIISTIYTYPYTNSDGQIVGDFFTLTFEDGGTFSSTDLETGTQYWYLLEGVVPIIIKPFT